MAKLGASDFEWDFAKGTATVRSPAPFTGKAVFHAHPHGGAPQLTGNLRVPTLGGPALSLTGKRFKATLTDEVPVDEKRDLGTESGMIVE